MNALDLSTVFELRFEFESDENKETFDIHYPQTKRLDSQSASVPE
jgi:hypothetical protein